MIERLLQRERLFRVITPESFEEWFHDYMITFPKCVHDGIIAIDLSFLHSIGLLKCKSSESDISKSLTDYFHVIESWEKITLYNKRFLIWIVPKIIEGIPSTHTFICVISENVPQLEAVFSTSGIYNAPRLILKILEYFLKDIEENEELITRIEN